LNTNLVLNQQVKVIADPYACPKQQLQQFRKILTKRGLLIEASKFFYAKPGAEIVLRNDGSFGVSLKERENKILDRRTVEEGEFRIRDNKIICKQDSNW